MEELNGHMDAAKDEMSLAIDHLQKELSKVRAGKASPAMLDGILVDYYGTPTALSQVANITTPDSKMLSVTPWEKNMIGPIEQAIFASNIGLTPQNNGEMVVINIPPLTQERRINLVKTCKIYGEEAKVSLRNARQKIMELIKKSVKDGLSEDMGKTKEEEVEKLVKSYTNRVIEVITAKEAMIMTI